MTYTITKEFHFSASHVLDGLPEGHQCGRLHGHNYRVEFVLASESLNALGFVRDYGDLDAVADWIKTTLDHRHLGGGGIVGVMDRQSTAENLADYLFWAFVGHYPELVAVRVSETPRTWAEFKP